MEADYEDAEGRLYNLITAETLPDQHEQLTLTGKLNSTNKALLVRLPKGITRQQHNQEFPIIPADGVIHLVTYLTRTKVEFVITDTIYGKGRATGVLIVGG